MSSATADSYPESVASCTPPPPPTPSPRPPPAGPRGAAVRRQLDFTSAAAACGDDDLDDDLLCRLVDDIERTYGQAKRRAPPCVCGRGECAVEQDQSGRLVYVCPARPKCKHVALCKEDDLNPKSQPALSIHCKTSDPCLLNSSNDHMLDAITAINVSPQGAGATIPLYVSPQGAHATTPVTIGLQGAGATSRHNVRPQGARSNGERPICSCTAGKCIIVKENGKEYYVCPIRKGQGACSHKIEKNKQIEDNDMNGGNHLNDNSVEKVTHGNNLVQEGDNNANGSVIPGQPEDDEWPFDIIHDEIVPTAPAAPCDEIRQDPPSMLYQPIAIVKTPTKSPIPPYGTHSPATPCSNDIRFYCDEKGHWKARECPKSSACFNCGKEGHWKANCPLLRGRGGS